MLMPKLLVHVLLIFSKSVCLNFCIFSLKLSVFYESVRHGNDAIPLGVQLRNHQRSGIFSNLKQEQVSQLQYHSHTTNLTIQMLSAATKTIFPTRHSVEDTIIYHP